jgi:nitrogen fixation NifU-like protein
MRTIPAVPMDSQLHHANDEHAIIPEAQFWEHVHQPKNVGELTEPDGHAIGVGSCGDSLQICLRIRNECIEDIKQLPNGCSYTVACGSAMSQLAKGQGIEDALNLEPADIEKALGGLPEDHLHCARLAINTLGEAIADYFRCRTSYKISPKNETSPIA